MTKKRTTKDLLGTGPNPGPTMAEAAQQYNAMHQQELNQTGFASTEAPSWESQQAFSRQQEAKAAAAAKKNDAALKKQAQITNVKYTKAKGVK